MSDPLKTALDRLPHGPEFRFVDRLVALVPGKSGTGEYRVRGDESFLKGHFPGEPIMPGVILIEACAQLAGTVAQSDPSIPPLAHLKLTAIRGVKILGTARPGDCVQLDCQVSGRMAGLIQASVTATVEGRKILSGEVTLTGDETGARA